MLRFVGNDEEGVEVGGICVEEDEELIIDVDIVVVGVCVEEYEKVSVEVDVGVEVGGIKIGPF